MEPRETRIMPGARALRGRAAPEEELLARPESPRRWTLPITALRVIPPSSPAIWLADSPSAHSFFRRSTRSSVQPMSVLLDQHRVESNPVVPAALWPPEPASCRNSRKLSAASRDVVCDRLKTTICRDSRARVVTSGVHTFLEKPYRQWISARSQGRGGIGKGCADRVDRFRTAKYNVCLVPPRGRHKLFWETALERTCPCRRISCRLTRASTSLLSGAKALG